MAAFVLPSIAPVRAVKAHASNINSTSLLPRLSESTKRKRRPTWHLRMDNSGKETSKPSRKKTSNEGDDDDDDDDDERLQKDPVYVYREFGKVSAVAVLIGLVLFFYDILISLWVTTIGLLYALAVLFEVKGADTLFANVIKSSVVLCRSFVEGIRKGWKALRIEVRKVLED